MHLHYDAARLAVCKVEKSSCGQFYSEVYLKDDSPRLYNCLMEWVNACWPFFLKLALTDLVTIGLRCYVVLRCAGHSCIASIGYVVPSRTRFLPLGARVWPVGARVWPVWVWTAST